MNEKLKLIQVRHLKEVKKVPIKFLSFTEYQRFIEKKSKPNLKLVKN